MLLCVQEALLGLCCGPEAVLDGRALGEAAVALVSRLLTEGRPLPQPGLSWVSTLPQP